MQFDRGSLMTQCEVAELTPVGSPQLLEIARERKKAHEADRFCLTGPARRSYSAGSPQAVVVARRLPAQPVVGRLWIVGGLPGDER